MLKQFETSLFSTTRTNICIHPDDGLQICPKHVEFDCRNKLRINSAPSWFSLRRCIEIHRQQNILKNYKKIVEAS